MAKLDFISAHEKAHKVRRMFLALCVSRSWFYRWRDNAGARLATRAKEAQLVDRIRRVFKASRQTYGSPRIHRALCAEGWDVSKHRVSTLMKENGIHRKKRKNRCPSRPTAVMNSGLRQTF